jgi:hypothetical protein
VNEQGRRQRRLPFSVDAKVFDVIATMRGSEEPDVWVLRGNHHDAWVNGAEDPISGQVALLEEARALGPARSEWPLESQGGPFPAGDGAVFRGSRSAFTFPFRSRGKTGPDSSVKSCPNSAH